ncbi:hypothetical protein LIA77_02545 [Sarocladium implicatum]|nr:hypothetical protein LIA77_02545 [Sarocladium implicatum]
MSPSRSVVFILSHLDSNAPDHSTHEIPSIISTSPGCKFILERITTIPTRRSLTPRRPQVGTLPASRRPRGTGQVKLRTLLRQNRRLVIKEAHARSFPRVPPLAHCVRSLALSPSCRALAVRELCHFPSIILYRLRFGSNNRTKLIIMRPECTSFDSLPSADQPNPCNMLLRASVFLGSSACTKCGLTWSSCS